MVERICRLLTAVAFVGLAVPATHLPAQDSVTAVDGANTPHQPYTEVFKDNSISMRADGTAKSYETTYVQAEDSHHRRFGLETHISQSESGDPSIHGSVFDSENGTTTFWDNRTMRVVVANWPPEERRAGCWQGTEAMARIGFPLLPPDDLNLPIDGDQTSETPNDDEVIAERRVGPIREDLGIATIQGVEARGERWTWPATRDEAANRKRPFLTSERWVATGSRLLVRLVVEYPFRPGWTKRYSQEMVKLTMGEPDAKMFKPPEDYDVVTEEMHEVPCGHAQWPLP
jgi:hypothetical protein